MIIIEGTQLYWCDCETVHVSAPSAN